MNIKLTLFITFLGLFFIGCEKEPDDNGTPDEIVSTPIDAEVYCPDIVGDTGPWDGAYWFDSWYAVEKVDCGTYVVSEPNGSEGNVNYIIAGTEKAILFDTSTGENPIKYVTDSLVSVPLTVVLSHFHYDHIGNLDEFESSTFIDLQYLRDREGVNGEFEFTFDECLISNPASAIVENWIPHMGEIDLGGRMIEFWNIPGHTEESVALVDRENKYIFTGDYMYNGVLFAFLPGSDLDKYKESAEFIISEIDNEYVVFGAHGTPRNAFNKFQKIIDLVDCIQNGECIGTAMNVFGYPVISYNLNGLTMWTEG